MLGDGEYGKVVPPGDPDAIASAILDLLDHPARRKDCGTAARRRVLETYSYNAIVPQQEACYEAAMRRHASRTE